MSQNSGDITCPYVPEGSPCLLGAHAQECSCKGLPLRRCPGCDGVNRLLANFCRLCGEALEPRRWSTLGGEFSSPFLQVEVSLTAPEKRIWERSFSSPLVHPPFLLDDLPVVVERAGLLSVLHPTSGKPLLQERLIGVDQALAAPVLLQGLLLVATGETGVQNGKLFVTDLVEKLNLAPGAGSRRGAIPLKGDVCSHLASDGTRYAALCSHEDDRLQLTLLEATGQGLEARWTRVVVQEVPEPPRCHLALSPEAVWVALENGGLWAYEPTNGKLLGRHHFEGCAPAGLTSREGQVVLADDTGNLFRVRVEGGLRPHHLTDQLPSSPFALGAGKSKMVTTHGKTVAVVDLSDGRCQVFELPQYCTVAPLVTHGAAYVLSGDGTLYHLVTDSQNARVAGSQKIFPNPGTVNCSPVLSSGALLLCGPQGELAALPVEERSCVAS